MVDLSEADEFEFDYDSSPEPYQRIAAKLRRQSSVPSNMTEVIHLKKILWDQ